MKKVLVDDATTDRIHETFDRVMQCLGTPAPGVGTTKVVIIDPTVAINTLGLCLATVAFQAAGIDHDEISDKRFLDTIMELARNAPQDAESRRRRPGNRTRSPKENRR